MNAQDFEIAVVGGGPAGMIAAIAFAVEGRSTVLVAPPLSADARTTALMRSSVEELERLGAWAALRDEAAPLAAMRLIDDTRRLIRAPETTFYASELGFEAFGWNVENDRLNAALSARLDALAAEGAPLVRIAAPAEVIEAEERAVRIEAGGQTLRATLCVGADGLRSPAREAAGIECVGWDYQQAAFVTSLTHELPHGDSSTEFHTTTGPFTLVPLGPRRSSLVWVERRPRAEALAAIDEDILALEIERQARSFLGKMRVAAPRAVLPLSTQIARRFGANRIALVGEAAHRIPPIGAQGLNLGVRDVADLVEATRRASLESGDTGGPAVLTAYDRARRADVGPRTVGVDLLNRSLLTGFLPVQIARSLGLLVAAEVPPLRRLLMLGGLGEAVGARGRAPRVTASADAAGW